MVENIRGLMLKKYRPAGGIKVLGCSLPIALARCSTLEKRYIHDTIRQPFLLQMTKLFPMCAPLLHFYIGKKGKQKRIIYTSFQQLMHQTRRTLSSKSTSGGKYPSFPKCFLQSNCQISSLQLGREHES